MPDCPFCVINPLQTRIIAEKEHVFVVLSNPRLVAGHTLVIPRRHVEKPSELTLEERTELFATVLDMQDKIVSVFSKGCDIRQHYRPFMPQSWVKVNHVHFHLQPRDMEDELYRVSQVHEKQLWKESPNEERELFSRLFG